jgi:hypothetical protein
MKQNLTPAQKRALYNNPMLQAMEPKRKWINILGTELNPERIRVYSLSDEGVSIQFFTGEWMHWKLSPAKAREVMERIDNQLWGTLPENYLKAEALRNEDNEQRTKEFEKCLQKPNKPMTQAIKRMIAKRRPAPSTWGRGWLREQFAQAMQIQAEN